MRLLVAILFTIHACRSLAQGGEQVLATDSGRVVLHRFTTGQVSTKEWTDLNDRWGRSLAYRKDGGVIVDHQTRRFAGHASVHFAYHPNGAVSKAEFSEAPDGGIQWYRSTTTFDEAGNQTGFSEEGWDNDGPIGPRIIPSPGPGREPPAPKQEEVREQHMFINEYFVVARKNCRVRLRPKDPSPAARDIDATLLAGDTLRGGTYSMGERFDPPLEHVEVVATDRRGRPKFKVRRVDSVQVNDEHRRWYLIVGR